MSPNYRSHLKSLFFSSFESIFVVSLNYCRFGFAGHLWIQNSIVQSFEHLEITEQQFTTWTSNNCFPFSIHKFVSDIKLHQKKSLAWRQHTLDIQWLELQVVPSPLISTMHLSNNQNQWNTSKNKLCRLVGVLRLLVGVLRRFIFVSLGFKIHAEKMHPKDASFKWSCVIQPNSLFDVHFTCYFGNNHPNHWLWKYYGIVVSYRR